MFGMGGAIQPIEDSFWETCLKIITNLREAQEKVVLIVHKKCC